MKTYVRSEKHIIVGSHRGVPNQLAIENNRAFPNLFPNISDAVTLHQASGRLEAKSRFGVDPLAGSAKLTQRQRMAME